MITSSDPTKPGVSKSGGKPTLVTGKEGLLLSKAVKPLRHLYLKENRHLVTLGTVAWVRYKMSAYYKIQCLSGFCRCSPVVRYKKTSPTLLMNCYSEDRKFWGLGLPD